MTAGALRALEFDHIVEVVAGLAAISCGRDRLLDMQPMTEPAAVVKSLRATTEGVRFLEKHPGFPLRAPSDLDAVLEALGIESRALEPLRLRALADFLESVEQSAATIRKLEGSFPVLQSLANGAVSFRREIERVRAKIDAGGDLFDTASPALASIRERLRKQRARLRSTLDAYLRGRDTAKYLQEQVVTDRNGRYVLMVRAEHRAAIPGIVHGASASGASLFLEPLETVDINNEIVTLQEQEAEEIHRILLELTDAFRERSAEVFATVEVATELDVIQARARFAQIVGGVEPVISMDGSFELHRARHPLLMKSVYEHLDEGRQDEAIEPVPVDILLSPPARVLVITGPNTGGKTVALKTAGLLAAMAQSGLHVPAAPESRLPVFRTLFADIGDEQSISASLSTFSAHIANIVSMNRQLELPALVLLDEVGAGTDPVEGGALGTAIIDHFRQRGAHVFATTHYDSLKSYASTTEGVLSAAFGFNPETFAPTYRLIYGSPGRSLAIEIAARLGMPQGVIAAARENLTDREKQLAEHLARADQDLRRLEDERRAVARERAAVAESVHQLRSREEAVRGREDIYRRRLDAKLEEQIRTARREIDEIVKGLKAKAEELSEAAARQLHTEPRLVRNALSTGEVGAVRADARAALDRVAGRIKKGAAPAAAGEQPRTHEPAIALAPGVRVAVGTLGLEGVVLEVHDRHAEIDVRGKRLRAALRDLTAIAPAAIASNVKVNVDLQPRQDSPFELNVIGCTVDEALARTEKFLDQSTLGDQRSVRLIHGHGTGQLRRALAEFLRGHPLVSRFDPAPADQGGSGVTVVELKD